MNRVLYEATRIACFCLGLFLWFFYRFRVEGAENIPAKPPFIFLIKEGGGPMATICAVAAYVPMLVNLFRTGCTRPDKVTAVMHEDVWVRVFHRYSKMAPFFPVRPFSAGLLALGMMHQLQILREGGIAIINPEGDLSWDGQPLPIRPGAAWLALHTAVPLVPMACSAGAYDIWPLWQRRPSLRGRIVFRIGRPFQVCDRPMPRVTPKDIEHANARFRTVLDELCFGPGGVAEWAGPATREGVPLEQDRPELASPEPVSADGGNRPEPAVAGPQPRRDQEKERRWGVPLLLWRCPVCHVNDVLIHHRPWFRPQTVDCEACGTRWIVQRVPGKDLRLKVVGGPARLVGLDMPLSKWYAEMKASFRPSPIQARDGELPAGEELYLEVGGVDLLPYRPSVLFDAWTSGEAPREQPGGQGEVPDWATIGMGRLLLTNRRLLWEGPRGSLDWWWPDVKAVFQPWQSTLGISYGSALYRFTLGNEAGLKWLTYASTFAQAANAQQGAQPAQRVAGARQAAVQA